MRVLVVGSVHFDGSPEKTEMFRSACRDIGAALAKANCDLIVGTESPNSADRYVVDGFIAESGKRKVLVFRPETGETPFLRERDANLGRIEFTYHHLKGPWSAGRVPQIRAADGVIIIGGGRGTVQVGYSAPTLERPVLSIASFGGAAAEVWPVLEPFYKRLGADGAKIGDLRVAWQPANAALAVDILEKLRRRRIFVAEKLALPVSMLITVLLLLACWLYLFIKPPAIAGLAFFAMLGVSAFLGTALRNALTLTVDSTAEISRSKILTELSAGILLAFALGVIYLVGGFSVTGKFDFISSTNQPDDFQRIALSMTILGLSGGWLIEAVSNRVKEWLTGQLIR